MNATRNAAAERAVRSFKQGLGLDVTLAVLLAVIDYLGDTSVDWRLMLLALAKTVLQTVLAYLMRLKNPPAAEVVRPDDATPPAPAQPTAW